MAHLIKLEDYVSRYQYDMYRYPSQFSRLKRERWKRLKEEWETSYLNDDQSFDEFVEEQKKSVKGAFQFIKKLYKREEKEMQFLDDFQDKPYQFKYKNLEDVKNSFLRELFDFQLNWASSTIVEKSSMNNSYSFDPLLKWLLQAFPDNYFVLYYPIVKYPKALVQFDILLIGPTDVWCIVNVKGNQNTIFQSHSERYWQKTEGEEKKKIINPFLSLNRMSTVIKRILTEAELDLTVRKAIITKEGYVDIDAAWTGVEMIDQRNIDLWYKRMKNNSSPIKSVQLKFSEILLNLCQTTSEKRYDENNEAMITSEEDYEEHERF